MQHTKGEWKVGELRKNEGENFVDILNDNNDEIALVYDPLFNFPNEGSLLANAHLIAAAPDLLEACKEVVRLLELSDGIVSASMSDSIYITLSQAISKALNGKG